MRDFFPSLVWSSPVAIEIKHFDKVSETTRIVEGTEVSFSVWEGSQRHLCFRFTAEQSRKNLDVCCRPLTSMCLNQWGHFSLMRTDSLCLWLFNTAQMSLLEASVFSSPLYVCNFHWAAWVCCWAGPRSLWSRLIGLRRRIRAGISLSCAELPVNQMQSWCFQVQRV